jgi:hydroxyacylglutathione hydrolase
MTKPQVLQVMLAPFGFLYSNLIIAERTIVVDTGLPESGKAILQKLERAAVAPKDVSLILLTHYHPDHVGSTLELSQRLQAPVAIHGLDAENLQNGTVVPSQPTGWEGQVMRQTPMYKNSVMPRIKPEILLTDGFDLSPYGVAGKVVHTPGHTPGHSSVMLEGGQVVAGDAIAGNLFFHGEPSHPPFHDDLPTALQSIEKLLLLQPSRFYVGHRGPLEAAKVRAWLDQAYAASRRALGGVR